MTDYDPWAGEETTTERPATTPPKAKAKRAKAGKADDGDGQKTIATVLYEMALDRYELGVSTSKESFAIPKTGPRILRLFRGNAESLRNQLAREYYDETGKVAASGGLTDALASLSGIAQGTMPRRVHTRVAQHGGKTYIDVGDETGRAIEIDANGWRLVDEPPVLFSRVLTKALPEPKRGGDLNDLWFLMNVCEQDRVLLLAYWLTALEEDVPHPILNLSGEYGSAKTSAAKMLMMLLDPTEALVRTPPRDETQWVSTSAGAWVMALDNLSRVPDWFSDALCRAVTGASDVRRKLYTDGDPHVTQLKLCLIMTGIDLGSLKGDLTDRLLPVELGLLGGADRVEETHLWAMWSEI